ncbi:ribonuclease PH [Candidatus Dependentiae bacterium]|nr:ribonuclease PH [Candidatus Dependentiae bacterium]
MTLRRQGRSCDQMRDVRITYDIFGYAAGSVLLELGNTKVLCSVSLQPGVPPFLKGKRTGWLTAEYAMLPTATTVRTTRESEQGRKNGRNVEISRFIGRSLRAVVDLEKIGERTIIIDCDVLQADGSTRTACIIAANFALERAQHTWLASRIIDAPIMHDGIAAVSVGLYNGQILVDLDFSEDSNIDADFNIVMTRSGQFVEVQGTAERRPYTLQQCILVQEAAMRAAQTLFCVGQENARHTKERVDLKEAPVKSSSERSISEGKAPLFSLKNRLVSGM